MAPKNTFTRIRPANFVLYESKSEPWSIVIMTGIDTWYVTWR